MAHSSNSRIGIVGFETAETEQQAGLALGTRVVDSEGNERVYVKSNGNITQYSCLHINSAFTAGMITDALARSAGQIGLALITVSASDRYFWAATKWVNKPVRVLGSCALDKPLFTTGTAGALDDATASTSQVQVQGVVLVSSNPSATATSKGSVTQGQPIIRRLEV